MRRVHQPRQPSQPRWFLGFQRFDHKMRNNVFDNNVHSHTIQLICVCFVVRFLNNISPKIHFDFTISMHNFCILLYVRCVSDLKLECCERHFKISALSAFVPLGHGPLVQNKWNRHVKPGDGSMYTFTKICLAAITHKQYVILHPLTREATRTAARRHLRSTQLLLVERWSSAHRNDLRTPGLHTFFNVVHAKNINTFVYGGRCAYTMHKVLRESRRTLKWCVRTWWAILSQPICVSVSVWFRFVVGGCLGRFRIRPHMPHKQAT